MIKTMAVNEESIQPQEQPFSTKFNFDTGVDPPVWAMEVYKERKIISRIKKLVKIELGGEDESINTETNWIIY